VAQRGAGVGVCTESHMKLASGIAPIPLFLERGVRVGLGTDGAASNNDLDLFGEMDLTAKLHKVHRADPTTLDAATVLHLATRGGARVLGWKDVGFLEPGFQADLILLGSGHPHLHPMYHPVSQLVYSARGADVETAWIRGRMVMEKRRLLTLNEEEILANARRLASRIAQQATGNRQ
jgi:5-methylthioadenosine/S-adenosylhomocysteine deaminase